MAFYKQILGWHNQINRKLPWKNTNDAYKIWLSEIIMQQTRVEQGTPFYLKFEKNYPTIQYLASANLDRILKDWEGLGYYSRARNMHQAAKYIVEYHNGIFPNTYNELLKIKGIGKYTAAAIASFAYDLPHAVVDGNVYRVLSRYFEIKMPIDTTEGKKYFEQLAHSLLPPNNYGDYNQALMDFGALQCVPKSPKCGICELNHSCKSFQNDSVSLLPIKSKRLNQKDRFFNFILVKKENQIFISQRLQNDIWKSLYQIPYFETEKLQSKKQIKTEIYKIFMEKNIKMTLFKENKKQMLTHQNINASFSMIEVENDFKMPIDGIWIDENHVFDYAFPKIIKDFLLATY
jgi:A/G-specific adenine glycosylase